MRKLMVLFTSITMLIFLCVYNTSCGLVGSKHDLSTVEGSKAIKDELVSTIGGDKEVSQITLSSIEELSTQLDIAVITHQQGGKALSTSYDLNAQRQAMESELNKLLAKSVLKGETKKIEDIDFSSVPKHIEQAQKMIPEEYQYEAIQNYTIDFADNKRKDKFLLNVTKKGEGKELSGKQIVTNYYQIGFETQSDGTLVMNEQ